MFSRTLIKHLPSLKVKDVSVFTISVKWNPD